MARHPQGGSRQWSASLPSGGWVLHPKPHSQPASTMHPAGWGPDPCSQVCVHVCMCMCWGGASCCDGSGGIASAHPLVAVGVRSWTAPRTRGGRPGEGARGEWWGDSDCYGSVRGLGPLQDGLPADGCETLECNPMLPETYLKWSPWQLEFFPFFSVIDQVG